MSYFKKFTDFCAGFAAFSALMDLFLKFMSYTAYDQEGEPLGIKEKIKLFFDPEEGLQNYRLWLLLIATLLFSVILARLLPKLPSLSFAASLIPLTFTVNLLADGKLPERPMLYLLLAILHTVGALADCVLRDRERGTHQANLAVNLGSILSALGVLWIYFSVERFSLSQSQKLDYFEQKIHDLFLLQEDLSILWKLAILLLITTLISLILREIYFIDAILALLPTVCILTQYTAEKLPIVGDFLLTVVLVNCTARIALMISCPPSFKSIKKAKRD